MKDVTLKINTKYPTAFKQWCKDEGTNIQAICQEIFDMAVEQHEYGENLEEYMDKRMKDDGSDQKYESWRDEKCLTH